MIVLQTLVALMGLTFGAFAFDQFAIIVLELTAKGNASTIGNKDTIRTLNSHRFVVLVLRRLRRAISFEFDRWCSARSRLPDDT